MKGYFWGSAFVVRIDRHAPVQNPYQRTFAPTSLPGDLDAFHHLFILRFETVLGRGGFDFPATAWFSNPLLFFSLLSIRTVYVNSSPCTPNGFFDFVNPYISLHRPLWETVHAKFFATYVLWRFLLEDVSQLPII